MQLPRPAQALYKVIGNPSVRLGAVAALALVAVWGMQASTASQETDLSSMLEVRVGHLQLRWADPCACLRNWRSVLWEALADALPSSKHSQPHSCAGTHRSGSKDALCM